MVVILQFITNNINFIDIEVSLNLKKKICNKNKSSYIHYSLILKCQK